MRITVDNLRPDMVLAADIVDGGGRLLLPAGTALTERHLRYCQMWGIPDADVAGDDPPPTDDGAGGLDPAAIASAEARVRPRFRHADLGHPAVEALFRHCVHTAARQGA